MFGAAGYTALIEGLWVELVANSCDSGSAKGSAPVVASGISHLTGCVFGSRRSKEFGTKEGVEKALANISAHFDAVVVLGGNGSLKGAWEKLEKNGVPVIGIPATVDNDVFFTKNNLGFSSAAEEGVRLVDMLNGTMRTNERDHVVQIMGWNCVELSNFIGQATFADAIDTIEKRHKPHELAQVLEKNRTAGKTSNTVIFQEKVEKGVPRNIIAETRASIGLWEELCKYVGEDLRWNILGHAQRGAPPSARDRWLGFHYGKLAIELIQKGKFGLGIGLVGDEFTTLGLEEITRLNYKI